MLGIFQFILQIEQECNSD